MPYMTEEKRGKRMGESAEMYLETILVIERRSGQEGAHSIEIARELGYSKPSVSRAMARLRAEGYIALNESGRCALTPKGRELAEKIYERHILLTKVFTSLGVDEKTAARDACRIEHVISEETFRTIQEHMRRYGSDAPETERS